MSPQNLTPRSPIAVSLQRSLNPLVSECTAHPAPTNNPTCTALPRPSSLNANDSRRTTLKINYVRRCLFDQHAQSLRLEAQHELTGRRMLRNRLLALLSTLAYTSVVSQCRANQQSQLAHLRIFAQHFSK